VPPAEIAMNIENRVGSLAEITRILAEARVNVTGLTLGRHPDKMNLRLVVDDPELAIQALGRHGLEARRMEVISIRVKNTPGAIADAAGRLAKNGINVEAVFLSAKSSKGVDLILQVDDVERARAALRDHLAEEE